MIRNYTIIILIPLITFACGNQESEIMDESSNIEGAKLTEGNSDSLNLKSVEQSNIEKVALSFHKWYINGINDQSQNTPTSFEIVEGLNGKCKLEKEAYFAELRKLRTISEKFIQSELDRTRTCSEFLDSLNWSAYSSSEAYEYQDYCDLYHHYWIRSQEPFHGVEIKNAKKNNETSWSVTLVFFYSYDGKVYSEYSMPIIHLEKEQESWRITNITWEEKN